MNINTLKHKECFIFPYSNTTVILKNYLLKNNIRFNGFIDSFQKGKDISTTEDIKSIYFDYIFILSQNHFQAIYKELIKTIKKEKIILVNTNNFTSKYSFIHNVDTFIHTYNNQEKELEDYFNKNLLSYKLKDEILLIGIGFIDLNIKYLYLYLKKYSNLKVHLATDNLRDIEIFKEYSIDVVYYQSKEFLELVFRTKVKIIDHTPVDKLLVKSLQIGKSIQLWHGITIETLGVLANYKIIKYDIVLSTSKFVSEYSFSKIFDSKKIIHCGYPRNDVLHIDNIELLNIDKSLLNQMKSKEFKYIVYMPTHRPLSFEDNPIDYITLNKFAKENNIKFIIKMHPFVAEKYRDDLSSHQNSDYVYTHLIMYPPYMDIYPILKYSDMLISDYSSVYFDYLYVDKPILFFCYDYEEWAKGEQGVILDYFKHSPGDKCYNLDELLKNILKNLEKDSYKEERKVIFDKMFENQNKESTTLIYNKIKILLVTK